jgi:hypothetical protein
MKLHFERKKKRNLLLSVFYRLGKFPFVSSEWKMKVFLNLNWIFWRLAIEEAEKMYGFGNDSMRRKNLDFFLNRLNPNFIVMDLGCKYGDIAQIISKHVKLVVGVDQDAKAIEIAKNKNPAPNIDYIVSDAVAYLKNNTHSFDVLILSHIIEHLDNPDTFLKEFIHFFEYIYIEIPDLDESYLNHYRMKMNNVLNYTDNDHIWEFDRNSFKELLENTGLIILDAEFKYGVQK